MNYYLAYINKHGGSAFYELIIAENLKEAERKVSILYPNGYSIDVTEPIQ